MYYFVRVMKDQNITLAAKKLHISQPALSKTIKKLEQQFNQPLFIRNEQGILPTNRALVLYEKVCEIIQGYEEMEVLMQGNKGMLKGTLRIGMPPVIGTAIFVPILAKFNEQYPLIQLELIECGAQLVEHHLEHHQLDLGVVIAPIYDKTFQFSPIVTEEVVVVVPADHPLAQYDTITIEALKDESFLLLDKSFSLHHQIIEKCVNAGFEPTIFLESSQWDFIIKMVRYKQGITILPEPIIREVLERDTSLKKLSFNPRFEWNIGFIYHKHQFVSPIVQHFIEHTLSLKV